MTKAQTCTETTAQTGARMSMDEFWQLIDKLEAAGLVRTAYECDEPAQDMILVHPGISLTGLPGEIEESTILGQTEDGMMSAVSEATSSAYEVDDLAVLFDKERADAMEWQYLSLEDHYGDADDDKDELT